jgi:DNA helicase-2/ATP-dependent DNA helicase PcrA
VVALEDKNYENKGEVNGSINVPKILNRFINTEAEDNEDLRRLIYVAMTRAKKNLNMSYSRIGYTGNAQSITCLLQPQIDSNSLSLIEIADSTLPDYTGTKEVIELDQEYLELVNEKLKEFNISTSSTNNWNDCQNKFFYHNICKIPGLPSAPTSFGSLLHSVLQSICTSNCLNPTQAQISNFVDEIFVNYQNQFHALHRSIYKRYAKFVIQNYLEAFPIVKRPLHIEKYLTCTLPSGVRLHGYIDRVDMNDNNIHVIDYKSSKYSEKLLPFENDNNMGSGYWRQGMIYKQLIENNFTDKNNIALSFHYLVLNKIIDFNTEANIGFDNWLSKIWNEIQSLSFNESCNDEKCIYCKKD